MNNIIELDDQRPHLTIITLDGNVHVVPVLLIENWIAGRVPIRDYDIPVIQTVLKEWLEKID